MYRLIFCLRKISLIKGSLFWTNFFFELCKNALGEKEIQTKCFFPSLD